VGLVGPNGAGKTTVLRAIKGTLSPGAGEVLLDGGDPAESLSAREAGRRVASVPQETSLAFDFRVRQIVEMGRTPHLGRFDGHGPDDERAVREAMDAGGVARFADRAITEVSGASQQGSCWPGRCCWQETPSLLLDEPTASLDVNHAVRTLELVRRLVDDGRARARGDPRPRHGRAVLRRDCRPRERRRPGRRPARGCVDGGDAPGRVRRRGVRRRESGDGIADGHRVRRGRRGDSADSAELAELLRIHVVGSGQPAGRAVARLAAAGHAVSVGVIPEGDAAAGIAADADAQIVTAPPFAAVPPERRAEAVVFAREADVTVAVGEAGKAGSEAGGETAANAAVLTASDRIAHVDDTFDDGELLDAVRGRTADTAPDR